MPVTILMPALSPTMEEGTLSKWLIKEGDSIKTGDILAEIETDKAVMEFESSEDGIVTSLLIENGTQAVKINSPIAIITLEGENLPKSEDFDDNSLPIIPSKDLKIQSAQESKLSQVENLNSNHYDLLTFDECTHENQF